MKQLLPFIILISSVLHLQAQLYGNEWIEDYTKPYFKIEVSADGIYRIPYATLASPSVFGNTLGSLNLNTLVLYHNGQKVPIYISTNANFGTGDYIEFYGLKNRGEMDSLLYRTGSDQMNPTFSLFTNTSIYYLGTSSTNNPRYVVTTNNVNNPPTKEEYFMYTTQVNYPNGMYYGGKYYSVGGTETYKSIYDVGEGYSCSPYFGNNGAQNFDAPTPGLYLNGPTTATFRSIYANNSYENHDIAIQINSNTVYSQQAYGFQLNHVNVQVPLSALVNGNNTVSYFDAGNGISQNKNTVGTVGIEYPHNFDFGGASTFSFSIAASATEKYLEVNNFASLNTQPLLYDITNGLIYVGAAPANSQPVKFKLQPSATDRQMFLRADNATTFTTVNQVTPVNFTDFSHPDNQGEYFIISNSQLYNDGNFPVTNWVEEYRKYRDRDENPISGKYYHARIVDIEQLYDQFGYGIRKSPLGIRNFINYAAHSWTPALKYVFLIGKGREAKDYRGGPGTTAYDQCLVPTFGYPGSDNLLAASRESDTTCVGIGRLAAKNGTQVRDYLDKIKLYEQEQDNYLCNQDIPGKEWQKEILHFSGGTTPTEQFLFRYYVGSYERMAVDTFWGAHVSTYSKTSNAPIDVTVSQQIKDKINAGVSWITFFGHSATGAFDFSIDEPENYTNYGKYPIMLSNGCFSGFIHDANPGYSERFVLTPNKGVVAFMATSSLSVSSGLHVFSDALYRNVCNKEYNQPLGKSFQYTLKDIFTDPTTSDFAAEVAYEMTLHGDPGIKPNQYAKPDYAIDASSVYTTPLTVTPDVDSFDVNIAITNLGKAIANDNINVTLKRTIFDNSNNPVYYYYNKYINGPYFKDTVSFKLPVNISTLGYGQNLFEPYVDADFETDEMGECNNNLSAAATAYIQNDDIIPIWPYEFAIVPQKGVTLKGSTVNPFAPLRSYRFQIDTTELFNSPKLKETVVTQTGGVVPCPTDSAYYDKDSTVFYWRVKWDTTGKQWHYSSFIYLKGEYPGWNQSHYFQYKKDDYQNVILDSTRIFKFPPSTNQIHVRTGKANVVGGNVDYETLGWDYNNYNEYRYRMGGCGYSEGLTFAVIDPVSGLPWISHNFNSDNFGDDFGNIHCAGKGDQPGFDFSTTGSTTNTNPNFAGLGWDSIVRKFIDAIPSGYFVLVYSVNNPPYTSWSSRLTNALGQLGLVTLPFTNGSMNGQLVYFTQKGNINYNPFYASSNGTTSIIDTSFSFLGSWYQGNFTTPKIGPATEWHSLHWEKQPLHAQATDVDSLDVIGVDNTGAETMLFRTAAANNLLGVNAPAIDPITYPYIKMRLNTFDDSLRTPTQLYYWRVLYKKPPEAAMNPSRHFVFTDQVNQGSDMHIEIALDNVSEVNMDSVLTKYTLRDATLNTYNSYIRYNKLDSFSTMNLVLDRNINGSNYSGTNRLIIEANPDNDQIEQYHFNNFAELDFGTITDKINPLLDVTFDNQHILNGDIVSAKPNILISLRDENKFLALDTSSLIDVYIRYPGAAVPTKMVYDNVTMTFYPANSSNLSHSNKASVELKPIFTVDGTYELLVKDRDRSGNNSATTDERYTGNNPATFFDYKISFEVITRPMITNVLNYPNPFTTKTHFVFTITGSEVPDFMKIQILNIKGTVVKEIFKDELGPLHIGRNMTEYAWDGRDQYGDLLANGIYFYHVSTRLDDKPMDQMGMSYDKFFKKGFGKMALIR